MWHLGMWLRGGLGGTTGLSLRGLFQPKQFHGFPEPQECLCLGPTPAFPCEIPPAQQRRLQAELSANIPHPSRNGSSRTDTKASCALQSSHRNKTTRKSFLTKKRTENLHGILTEEGPTFRRSWGCALKG